MGALIGTQAGRELEIVNSFELAAKQDEETKEWNINHEFFVSRQAQCEYSPSSLLQRMMVDQPV
jgi:COP9 signalosome complex subunit 6